MERLGPMIDSQTAAGPAFAFPSVATIVLCLGLAMLAAAAIVLMRSRWGQAQPLSKCVALSVIVHLLLTIYAYQARLLSPSPHPLGGNDDLEFTLLADSADSVFTEAPQPLPNQPPEPAEPMEPAEPQPPADAAEPVEAVEAAEPAPPQTNEPPDAPALLAQPADIAPMPAAEPAAAPESPPQAPPEAVAENPLPPDIELPSSANEPAATEIAAAEAAAAEPLDLESLLPDAGATASADPLVPPNDEGNMQRLVNVTIDSIDTASAESATASATAPIAAAALVPPATAALASASTIRVTDLPTRAADGETMPRPYHARQGDNRANSLQRFGGNEQTEAAVAAALAWLAANQNPDGRWDASRFGAGQEHKVLGHDRNGAGRDADTGVSGLALLAFLGAGHTHLEGPYRETVQRGLEFLLRSQSADGCLAGEASLYARMYCHGIALLTISEAYAITGDARLRPFVEGGVQYTVRAQNSRDGGWRYLPGDAGDMSQFGWQLMALKSAELAGVKVPVQTRAGMIQFLHSAATGPHKGLSGYRPHSPPSRTMTAEAVVCRVFLNLERNPAAIDEAVRYLLEEPPAAGTPNLYYWYYASLALFQLQGPAWQTWNAALQKQLLSRQDSAAPNAGSWSPNTVWGGYGGRVYSTAMAALCLEVYYRYLPLYEAN